MKPETFDKIHNALKTYEGCFATLWQYMHSHRQLHISLKRHGEESFTYLTCYGCIRLQAQTSWDNAQIQIQETAPGTYAVVDSRNGLYVECQAIGMYPDNGRSEIF